MTLLKELEKLHGGRKALAKKLGITPEALSNASRRESVVGYTYNIAKRLNGSFKLQIVEDGHLITVSREKV